MTIFTSYRDHNFGIVPNYWPSFIIEGFYPLLDGIICVIKVLSVFQPNIYRFNKLKSLKVAQVKDEMNDDEDDGLKVCLML